MNKLKIPCGDWIYPAQDSTSGVRYPIEHPLVAEIFLSEAEAGQRVSGHSGIPKHLRGPRYLEVLVLEHGQALQIISLKNSQEELFHQGVGFEIEYDPGRLVRSRSLSDFTNADKNAIFFADVLLDAHLAGQALPKQIIFRKATMPEIESLGKW